jgi:hypothetical protein
MMKYMANPKAYTIKKWLSELLKEKYPPHDNIAERVSTAIVTDKDLDDFGKLITTIFEVAYLKAVYDHKEQLDKLGVKVEIVPESNH